MNTPEPCCSCHYLYIDGLHEDDPAECMLGLPMMKGCPWFRQWDSPECRKEYRDDQRWEDAREFRATGTIRRLESKTKECGEERTQGATLEGE